MKIKIDYLEPNLTGAEKDIIFITVSEGKHCKGIDLHYSGNKEELFSMLEDALNFLISLIIKEKPMKKKKGKSKKGKM